MVTIGEYVGRSTTREVASGVSVGASVGSSTGFAVASALGVKAVLASDVRVGAWVLVLVGEIVG